MPGGKSQSACPNGPDHCSGADWIFDVAQCEGIPRSQTVDNLLAEDETHEVIKIIYGIHMYIIHIN